MLTILWNCTEDLPTQTEPIFKPEISDLNAPVLIYNQSLHTLPISVKVSDPQGLNDIKNVSYDISKVSTGQSFIQGELKDEGKDGDIIPNDGIFTTSIDNRFARNDTGKFIVQVSAQDLNGNTSEPLSAIILVLAGLENLPPVIIEVNAPSAVALDSSFDFLLTAQVTDPDGLSDVHKVVYQFYPPAYPNPAIEDTLSDSGELGDITPGDGIYSIVLESELLEEASDYYIRLQAEDKVGNKSEAELVIIHGFFLRPQSPLISNVVAPDTVKIHPTNTTPILVTVDVSDPQGLADINWVRFRSFLPDGKESTQSPFHLSDNGLNGDVTAGDGTYSLQIILPSANAVPPVQRGNFTFEFQAQDKSELLSNIIEHIMTVVD